MPNSTPSRPSEYSSGTLLERIKHRDPDAWRRFAMLYGQIVYRWSRRYGLDPHDAADVTQDVFRAVAQHIERFERRTPDQSLRAWLWTVTRNKVRDYYRRRQSMPLGAGGSTAQQQLEQLPALDDTHESVEQTTGELAQRALTFIQNEFEPSTWRAFLATAVEGQSACEAAAELGITVAAVYKAKSRVLQRLRHELDGLLE